MCVLTTHFRRISSTRVRHEYRLQKICFQILYKIKYYSIAKLNYANSIKFIFQEKNYDFSM